MKQLTDLIEVDALEYIDKIGAMGGMLKALEIFYPQREIAGSAYQFQLLLDKNEQSIVGVNINADETKTEIPILEIDFEAEVRQIERIKAFKAAQNPKS